MTENLYFTSSPVFEIDGQVYGELARDIVRLQVEEGTHGLKTLWVKLAAIGPATDSGGEEETLNYLDGRILDFGKEINVAIGPPDSQRTIFHGSISALEVSFEEGEEPEVTFYAEDNLMDLRMTRRMKTYEQMTDADIASEIASAHSLNPAVDAQGPTYDVVQQWNMSDLAFLRERARLLQAEVWVESDTLHFKTRDRRQGTTITLVRGNDLIRVQASADLAHQRTEVRVSGYDASAREAIDESAGKDAVAAEISGGRTGPSILQNAFGERISHRVREVCLNSSEAADWARAEMLRRARGFITVRGVTNGTPDMIVGSSLTLERMGGPFNGQGYYVTWVCHTYDLNQGHRTEFEAQRSTVG
ncbi:contractile injection system protein, VgrG/Pvc8 family [Desulfogranum marinum]|uniref:phage late control D family protein n=1 Tax=Desulfogranum marinum TaxID=453220 RepID=UPI0029C94070|nr:contractile injection system protein, VgrG/Pvc8 family [Desulfogranum marinum]